jgi:mannose-1-phosphate guanylyltransferase/mannose-1-phosphate guanylyltransferase/mannose-6-phosphate isomerase
MAAGGLCSVTVATNRIFPILLSGGAGTRLWPLSRESRPKQLLPLTGDTTLLQQTALRAADAARFEPLTVIGSVNHRFLIAEQLRQVGARSPTIVLEPVPRNTGAAAAVAALLARRSRPDALLLIMPADHRIENTEAFLAAVDAGIDAASNGALVLFGMKPTAPATGYGYIRAGQALPGAESRLVRKVAAFVEKPDRETAEGYLQSGEYLWNSGIFLLPAGALLAEMARHAPEILRHAEDALERAIRDSDFLRLDEAKFRLCPSVSIDHAVMERTHRAAVVPADFGWTDVGSWSTLWDIALRDGAGNALFGDVLVENTKSSYIRSEGPLVATIGVDDLVVVATADAVLVANKGQDQEIRKIVERLRTEHLDRT